MILKMMRIQAILGVILAILGFFGEFFWNFFQDLTGIFGGGAEMRNRHTFINIKHVFKYSLGLKLIFVHLFFLHETI